MNDTQHHALAYLLLVIYRTYYFIHPELPHYILNPELTSTQLTLGICLIPVYILIYYWIQYFLSVK